MATNGQAPMPRQTIAVVRTTILHVFHLQVAPTNDGGTELQFVTPQGEQLVVPLNQETALELGKALLAPSIAIATAEAAAGAGALRV